MSKKVCDLDVCVDCALWLANADASGLKYHYGDKWEERLEEINKGERALCQGGKYWIAYNMGEDEDNWFSWSPCDCCSSKLGGDRVRFALMKS